jgi:NitT/TauT family transport system ATP-binding protein
VIKLIDIHKQFQNVIVLDGINMEFEEGKITAILGPSGCGKTTLLSITAGLIEPTRGEVLGMELKESSFIFQEPRLLPWKNTIQNLEFVLPDSIEKSEKKQICNDILEQVGLSGFEKHYPSQLSGGMSQRLAMARAFIVKSDILFMDEPFQFLDLKRREQMIDLLKNLWIKTKPAVVIVTHDVQEALLLSDKIYILSDKPATVIKEIKNPIPFGLRTVKNAEFYKLEQEIINNYLLR